MRTLVLIASLLCPSLALAQPPVSSGAAQPRGEPPAILELQGLGEAEIHRRRTVVGRALVGPALLLALGSAAIVGGVGSFVTGLDCGGDLINFAPYAGGTPFRCNNDDRRIYGGLALAGLGIAAFVPSLLWVIGLDRRRACLDRALRAFAERVELTVAPTRLSLTLRQTF